MKITKSNLGFIVEYQNRIATGFNLVECINTVVKGA